MKNITRYVLIVALALAVLALAGCGAKDPAKGSSEPATGAPAETPTLEIVEPVEGATVPAGDVKVNSEVSGLKFTMPSNKNVAGEGHIHYTLDDRPFEMSITPDLVFKDVEPGEHTLEAELVQNNTDSFDPPIKQEITFIAE